MSLPLLTLTIALTSFLITNPIASAYSPPFNSNTLFSILLLLPLLPLFFCLAWMPFSPQPASPFPCNFGSLDFLDFQSVFAFTFPHLVPLLVTASSNGASVDSLSHSLSLSKKLLIGAHSISLFHFFTWIMLARFLMMMLPLSRPPSLLWRKFLCPPPILLPVLWLPCIPTKCLPHTLTSFLSCLLKSLSGAWILWPNSLMPFPLTFKMHLMLTQLTCLPIYQLLWLAPPSLVLFITSELLLFASTLGSTTKRGWLPKCQPQIEPYPVIYCPCCSHLLSLSLHFCYRPSHLSLVCPLTMSPPWLACFCLLPNKQCNATNLLLLPSLLLSLLTLLPISRAPTPMAFPVVCFVAIPIISSISVPVMVPPKLLLGPILGRQQKAIALQNYGSKSLATHRYCIEQTHPCIGITAIKLPLLSEYPPWQFF